MSPRGQLEAASFGFGGQYITVVVTTSCKFWSLMTPSLPCNFGGASNVPITFHNFRICLFTRMGTPVDMFENRVWPQLHLTSKCRPRFRVLDSFMAPSQTQWNGRRVSVRPMMCALISSLMSLILYARRALSRLSQFA